VAERGATVAAMTVNELIRALQSVPPEERELTCKFAVPGMGEATAYFQGVQTIGVEQEPVYEPGTRNINKYISVFVLG